MRPRFDPRTLAVPPTATLRKAIETINEGGAGIALVIGTAGELLGTVTDGDIRRALLRGLDLNSPIPEAMYRDALTAPVGTSLAELLKIARERSVRQVPLLDASGAVVDLALLSALVPEEPHPNKVLLMVGGRGSRLSPLTDGTPKTLLNVGGRPLLDTILGQLGEHNFTEIILAVHFRADQIRAFCGNGSRWGLNIRYLEEQEFMGTAGSLAAARPWLNEPFVVMNGDLLTLVNLEQFLAYHVDNHHEATVAVREYRVVVPFGTVEVVDGLVVGIKEKPSERFLINAGLYVLDPSVAELVPLGQRFDMPDLIQAAIEAGKVVGSFLVHEYWLDIGRLEDFERASVDYSQNFPPKHC